MGGSRTSTIVIDLSSDLAPSRKQPLMSQAIDLTLSDFSTPPDAGLLQSRSRSPSQTLTYGDAFCGGGGATRGAVMAGLRVKWGFDFWEHACANWQSNFPWANCYKMAAHEFVELALRSDPELMKVDILHLSPPCQCFSPAHSIEGRDDEMNTASLFAVASVIKVCRPRVVTLEQTFGIGFQQFGFYFNSLINMFTSLDFSVRWSFIPLAQWGLPARRQRLIIIASCPGEVLPEMPAPTHSETGSNGLKAFVSVNQVLATIPANASNHEKTKVFDPSRRQPPWDGNKILPRAITTGGGGNYHPSGDRDFTVREYATLQGYPLNHKFAGSYLKKIIGNSVPPIVSQVLFASIKKDLAKADGVEDPAI